MWPQLAWPHLMYLHGLVEPPAPACLLPAEVTKTKVRRQNVEQPDDADMEAKMSQMTNTWWCVLQQGQFSSSCLLGASCGATVPRHSSCQTARRHRLISVLHHAFDCSYILHHCIASHGCCRCVSYPQMLDSLHLRLHRMRERLRRHLGDGEDVLVREGPACCLPAACLLHGVLPALPSPARCLPWSCKQVYGLHPSNLHPRIVTRLFAVTPRPFAGVSVPAMRRHLHLA